MKLLIPILLCLFTSSVIANQRGVTEEGDVVILNSDGTWFYENSKLAHKAKLKSNNSIFTKPSKSNFVIKSKKNSSTFSINTKKWRFKKISGDSAKEYSFDFKTGDLYGMAITEQIKIDIEELVDIAFENAKEVAPDAKVVKKEYRTVNGVKVIYMELTGTIQSVKFKYLGYYYSDSSGSTQYLTYTGEDLVHKYKSDIDDFLNGFSVNQ